MKKTLNKFAVWLYDKTKRDNIKTPHEILGGLKVVESRLLPRGYCYIGTGTAEDIRNSSIDQRISTNLNLNPKNLLEHITEMSKLYSRIDTPSS